MIIFAFVDTGKFIMEQLGASLGGLLENQTLRCSYTKLILDSEIVNSMLTRSLI
jgi:hypothetical protein